MNFVSDVQQRSRQRRKGDVLIKVGAPATHVYILQSGWAVLKSRSKSKGNRILQSYLPGDVIGLSEIGSSFATHEVSMQTDGTVSRLPRVAFCKHLARYPRLEALFKAIGSLDLVALRYHNACMTSMSGSQKLKFHLLQLRSRQLVDDVGDGDRFQVPFSQVEIGQAIGMTSIYVNKLLRSLKDTGDIEICRPHFRLLKREIWEAETEFVDAYKDMDTSWFPEADFDEAGAPGAPPDDQAQWSLSARR